MSISKPLLVHLLEECLINWKSTPGANHRINPALRAQSSLTNTIFFVDPFLDKLWSEYGKAVKTAADFTVLDLFSMIRRMLVSLDMVRWKHPTQSFFQWLLRGVFVAIIQADTVIRA